MTTVGEVMSKHEKLYSPESLLELEVHSQKDVFNVWHRAMNAAGYPCYLSGKAKGQLKKMLGVLRHEQHLSPQHIAQLLVRVIWSWEDFCLFTLAEGAWKPPTSPQPGFLLTRIEVAVAKWCELPSPVDQGEVQPVALGGEKVTIPDGHKL